MKEGIKILEQRLAQQLGLTWNNNTQLWDCSGSIDLYDYELTRLPLKFGVIIGDFDCDNNKLTSFEGAPQKVEGNFYCYQNQLTSLQGAPQEVEGRFNCSYNQLTTLEGAPQKVGGSFYCNRNNLTSLEGAPLEVGGNFECSNNLVEFEKPDWLNCKAFLN